MRCSKTYPRRSRQCNERQDKLKVTEATSCLCKFNKADYIHDKDHTFHAREAGEVRGDDVGEAWGMGVDWEGGVAARLRPSDHETGRSIQIAITGSAFTLPSCSNYKWRWDYSQARRESCVTSVSGVTNILAVMR